MKKLFTLIFLTVLLFSSSLNAQIRRMYIIHVKFDSVTISGTDRTAFFGYIDSENGLTTAGIATNTITWDDLSSAVQSLITAGGTTLTNAVDDTTIKENGSSKIYVQNFVGGEDTLTQNSATPTVSASIGWVTNNTSATTITNFLGNPGAGIHDHKFIKIGDDSTIIQHGANIDCAGLDLQPASGDVLEAFWNGTRWFCRYFLIPI